MRKSKFIVLRYLTVTIALLLLGMFMSGCSDEAAPTNPSNENQSGTLSKRGPVVHKVSIGGADVCEAFGLPTGCDANFSLTAKEMADGSVSGQWQDSFGHGNGGIHVEITCLCVDGNQAWVSGVITHPKDFAGTPVLTRMADNGTAANDPLDQISFSFFNPTLDGEPLTCTDKPTQRDNPNWDPDDPDSPQYFPINLFDLTHGQVKVQ